MVTGYTPSFPGLTTTNTYDKRLQPVILSAAAPSQTVFSVSYDFHLGTGDNGNVFLVQNNRDINRTQAFTYDQMNRIAFAWTSGALWGERFEIDAWGNLNRIRACQTGDPCSGKPQGENLDQASNLRNQLVGYSYDAAGSLLNDGLGHNLAYDAENRIKTAAGVNYTYDGDGKRVKKDAGKLYWTGTGSDPLAETDLSGNATADYVFFNGKRIARVDLPSGTPHYYFSDHLGSASVITNATGTTIEQESDYYPYGGERTLTTGPNNYRFTGKERDSESGLDMFGARYYGSSLGRFMTPDWAAKPITVPYANFGNPQSLNLYSYVENNPETLIDTDGHEIIYADNLRNAQVVKDSVQAILANPHTSGNLSGYVGPNNPNLIIQSGDLSAGDTRTVNPDGSVTTTTVQGNTAPDIQTTSSSSTDINGVTTTTGPETTLTGATITIDDRTSKGDVPGVMVHESVHAGEAKANPAQFSKDAAAEKSLPHDQRPQEQRANAAQKAYGNEIKKEVKQIEKQRKKDDQ